MFKYFLLILCLSLGATQAGAGELVQDTQAFLYYKIPFDGATVADRAHQYGFRMDRGYVDQDRAIDMNRVMQRSAVMDFRMSSAEPVEFRVHGVDYLQKYRLMQADAGATEATDSTASEAVDETTKPAMEEAAAESEPAVAEETVEAAEPEEGVLDDIPTGVLIGVAIFAGILAGAGG